MHYQMIHRSINFENYKTSALFCNNLQSLPPFNGVFTLTCASYFIHTLLSLSMDNLSIRPHLSSWANIWHPRFRFWFYCLCRSALLRTFFGVRESVMLCYMLTILCRQKGESIPSSPLFLKIVPLKWFSLFCTVLPSFPPLPKSGI